ncbi:MAG: hypothetical protein MJ198_00320 [Bacteroidales bacterium]|nr:hypothetical protein [Bacteroidales bacterium]
MKISVKSFVATVLLALFTTFQGFSGEVVVGEGTSSANSFPYYNNYNYATTQSIYTASEIGVAAKITSIASLVASFVVLPMTDSSTVGAIN